MVPKISFRISELQKFTKIQKIQSDHTERNIRNDLEKLISNDINDNNLQQIISKEAELAEFEKEKTF